MAYRYILRYYIDPGFHEDDRVRELVEFCQKSRIAEVMYFYNPEELFQGYPDSAEVDRWFALAKKVKAALTAGGIAMSLNPWTTTVHVARGRKLGKGQQNFQLMVGENGVTSPITSCPLDKNWQRQLAELFCRMAVEIQPTAIWIEDDWRLHNHGAEMGYGGCFCPLHLQRFADKTGIRTDRETLLKNLTAPGQPHPWRQPWLEVCRESLLEPAEYVRRRIHEVNPQVRFGLMSSCPDVHSVEGRDWNGFKNALSPETKLLSRPNLGPYTEAQALLFFPTRTRQTVSEFTPGTIEIYPELENSPRCGGYSKSRAYAGWEIASSVAYGAQGITINHYDMMGNGTALDPQFGAMLAAKRPQLDTLAAMGLDEANAVGVDVLYNPQVAASARCHQPGTLNGLIANSVMWGDVFGICGISEHLTQFHNPKRLTAVSGDMLWTLDDAALLKFLSGKVLLDAASVQIVQERGFGEYLGLRHGAPGGDDGHAFEVFEDGDAAYYGVGYPRACAQRDGHYWVMQPDTGAEILSTIRKYDRSILYPGLVKFQNKLGGTVYSCSHYLGKDQFFMAFFNVFRAKFLQKLVASTATPAVFGENYPLNVYCNQLADSYVITVTNPTLDAIDQVKLSCHNVPCHQVEILDAAGRWQPGAWAQLPGLPPLGACYLRIK